MLGVQQEGCKLCRAKFPILLRAGVEVHPQESLAIHDGYIVEAIAVEVACTYRDRHGLFSDLSIRAQHNGFLGGCVDDARAADSSPDIGCARGALETWILDEVCLSEDRRG